VKQWQDIELDSGTETFSFMSVGTQIFTAQSHSHCVQWPIFQIVFVPVTLLLLLIVSTLGKSGV
jgi:hypothetical protein